MELEALLPLDEDDLLELLGQELLRESRAVGPRERLRQIRAGAEWLAAWLDRESSRNLQGSQDSEAS